MEKHNLDSKKMFQLYKSVTLPTNRTVHFYISYQIQIRSEYYKMLNLLTPNPFIIPNSRYITDFDIDINGKLALVSSSVPNNISLIDIGFLHDSANVYLPKEPLSSKKLNNLNISQLQWYPHDSGMFITFSSDKELSIWDTEEFCCAAKFPSKYRINTFQMSPIAKFHSIIALGLQNKQLKLVDLRTSNSLVELTGHRSAIRNVCWSRVDEHLLLAGDHLGYISAWDIRNVGSPVFWFNQYNSIEMNDFVSKFQLPLAHESSIVSMCTLTRLNYLVSLSDDQYISIWNLSTGKRISTIFNDNACEYFPSRKYTIVSSGMRPETYLNEDLIFMPGGKLPFAYTIGGESNSIFEDSIFSNSNTQIIRLHPYHPIIFTSGHNSNLNVWKCNFHRRPSKLNEKYYQDTWSESSS